MRIASNGFTILTILAHTLSHPNTPTHPHTPDTTQAAKYAVAKFDNKADNPFELSFKKGDRLLIVEETFKLSSEWWTCELDGKRGAVPANYMRKE